MARGNPGIILQIEGGGKAIAYHKEQETAFKELKKHYIHYMTDDYHPIVEDGKEKVGLKDSSKLKIIGYCE